MVNTNMTFVFKHPKFYRIPRDKSDQVISDEASTEATSVHPGPGHKQQTSSNKQQAGEAQASSYKDSSNR